MRSVGIFERMSRNERFSRAVGVLATWLVAVAPLLPVAPAFAAGGDTITTPDVPHEIPIEVEIELAPAASLKQAPLWKELVQLLEEPYLAPSHGPGFGPSGVERRPGFGVAMPALNVWALDYNFLTGQTMRLRPSDGEVSLDQPGPLFDPDEIVPTDPDPTNPNVPTQIRTVIGALVASDDDILDPGEVDGTSPCSTCGYLLVSNPDGDPRIPPDGAVVAIPAFFDGMLHEWDPVAQEYEEVIELEMPVNEEHFFREDTDTAGVVLPLQASIGRPAAEMLGKALFWDMQVGSDGVQACGSCHFHAGVDNRTRNQLNPGHLGGDLDLEVFGNRAAPPADPQDLNQDVVADDFPFHKLVDPTIPGEPLLNPANVAADSDDVMSSMGVSRFKEFVDIPTPGPDAFGPAVSGVRPLLPDIGADAPDPIPVMDGLRRVEPRHTPTFHGTAFNFDNFWDARARFHFNGGSVFGQTDPYYHVFVNDGTAAGAMHGLPAPEDNDGPIEGWAPPAGEDPVPVRIKFSSLASQAVGPPLSDFEMAFIGRSWAKIGKKLLQTGGSDLFSDGFESGDDSAWGAEYHSPYQVVPLANQLVHVDDSVLGPLSNQGGTVCLDLGRDTAPGKPGLCVSYNELIEASFLPQLWSNVTQHLAVIGDPADGFDGVRLELAAGAADPVNTDQLTQMEANFALFFGLSVQAYESLTIPDHTPFDQFMDANPLAANGIGEPGSQGVLYPTLIPDLVGGGLVLIADDPSTPHYDGFGPEEVFGFDIFAGGNLTAALPVGSERNPDGFGMNPFARSARCMLCHLGPEQTDHSINVAHGLLKGDAEYEFPTPPTVIDPFGDEVPAPEPPGPIAAVGGLILAEEVEETAQDAVEVEPQNFVAVDILVDDPDTPWIDESTFDDRIIAQPRAFAFGDQGIYNIGVRPSTEDVGRGGDDPFGWPLSLAALTLKNIGGEDFEPCDNPSDFLAHPTGCAMTNFDPDIDAAGGLFEESGDGAFFPGTTHTLQSINPGFEREPITPMLPEYMAEWINGVPAGELHPTIDEMAGFAPNTITAPNGGPGIEFTEILFGADLHCGTYDPALYGAGPPNYGWGPECPNNQSGVTGNMEYPLHGTWPFPNRVRRDGQFKAPALRNVELTGPYFHTGSYLTLRQVVDFYMRGGDFPITNAEDRDQHMVDIEEQAFGFGRTTGADLAFFADALPDPVYQYDVMPDTDHPVTPEPATLTREAAKNAIVTFLLALTDPRVKYEKAPFDHPEIFVPVDGTAPENTGGRAALLADARFRQVPEIGADGRPTALPNFLNISSTPIAGDRNDHFDGN